MTSKKSFKVSVFFRSQLSAENYTTLSWPHTKLTR